MNSIFAHDIAKQYRDRKFRLLNGTSTSVGFFMSCSSSVTILQEGSYADKYSFVAEWFDNVATLKRRFLLFYFPLDDSIEMFDCKVRKTYVRRTKIPGIHIKNFYIGASMLILGRIIKIIDFANEDTRKRLQKSMQLTFAMIKPVELRLVGDIITEIYERGFQISQMKMATLTLDDINALFKDDMRSNSFPFTKEYLKGQRVIGLQLFGADAVCAWRAAMGCEDPKLAAPGSIRAKFGSDAVRNCVHGSSSPERAHEDLAYFFPSGAERMARLRLTPCLSNCTLCVVKPHAIVEGKLGGILRALDEGGFEVTALVMQQLETVNALEFLEVYKGIVTEFKAMVEELSRGPCVALEVVSKRRDLNSAVELRKLVGPVDPEIGRLLRPGTLRAQFGRTRVHNAVHCSDLPEDGLLEVEYFFNILNL